VEKEGIITITSVKKKRELSIRGRAVLRGLGLRKEGPVKAGYIKLVGGGVGLSQSRVGGEVLEGGRFSGAGWEMHFEPEEGKSRRGS